MTKTNAMRMLDKAKIKYEPIEYQVDDNDLSGVSIAAKVGLDCEMVFKTLVAKGDKTGPVVMCIPVHREIDLKKAAKATGNKSLEMVHVKDLLGLTGYIRGGCSPIGMKKKFATYIEESCLQLEKITVSAGIKGCQLLLDRAQLVEFTQATVCSLAF
ncbi:MAG: Cys-tRNA(Pro) deacylase [Clostridia bacterium]|nr:Cys-tRNA(Pro) deacylase [Clostridia bacterium]